MFVFSVSSFLFGLYSFFSSGYISIQNIVLSGNKEAPSELLRNIAENVQNQKIFGFFKKDNFLLFNRKNFLSQVHESMPIVKDVAISFQGLETLDLLISERTPFAFWCGGESTVSKDCLIIDETGFAFKEKTEDLKLLYIYDDLATSSPSIKDTLYFDSNSLVEISAFLSSLSWSIKEVRAKNGYFVFNIDQGGELRLPFDFDLDELKNRLPLVKSELEKENYKFQYLDFRFNDKAFIKR